jgi:hypothetical protein
MLAGGGSRRHSIEPVEPRQAPRTKCMRPPSASRQTTADGRSGDERDDLVDAIRYAVLRKLAPGLRHALMGELQAIELSAELAARMLRAGADFAEVRDSVARIPHQCTAAVKTGRSVIELLRPEEGTTTPVSEGVGLCLKLAGEDWFLRGIEVITDLPEADVHISKAALQELVVTALLVLSDMHDQPADLHVVVRPVDDRVDVVVRARAAERVASVPPLGQYRKLVWADLKLLAHAHGVPCVCEGDTASLQFQRASPP